MFLFSRVFFFGLATHFSASDLSCIKAVKGVKKNRHSVFPKRLHHVRMTTVQCRSFFLVLCPHVSLQSLKKRAVEVFCTKQSGAETKRFFEQTFRNKQCCFDFFRFPCFPCPGLRSRAGAEAYEASDVSPRRNTKMAFVFFKAFFYI